MAVHAIWAPVRRALAVAGVVLAAGCGGGGGRSVSGADATNLIGLGRMGATRLALPTGYSVIDVCEQVDSNAQFAGDSKLSETGVVAFQSYDPVAGHDRAARWQGGVLTRLAVPRRTTNSSACGVNDAGEVVGWVSDGRTRTGVLWDVSGAAHTFAAEQKTSKVTVATEVNNQGQCLVDMTTKSGSGSYVYAGGSYAPLGFGGANRIIDCGWILSSEGSYPNYAVYAYIPATGLRHMLPHLPGCDYSGVTAINEQGLAVGSSQTDNVLGSSRPVMWAINAAGVGTPTNLLEAIRLSMPNAYTGGAAGINDAGQVVGRVGLRQDDGSSVAAPFLYDPATGQTINLNAMLSPDRLARYSNLNPAGINNTGWIVCGAETADTQRPCVLLLVPTAG